MRDIRLQDLHKQGRLAGSSRAEAVRLKSDALAGALITPSNPSAPQPFCGNPRAKRTESKPSHSDSVVGGLIRLLSRSVLVSSIPTQSML